MMNDVLCPGEPAPREGAVQLGCEDPPGRGAEGCRETLPPAEARVSAAARLPLQLRYQLHTFKYTHVLK